MGNCMTDFCIDDIDFSVYENLSSKEIEDAAKEYHDVPMMWPGLSCDSALKVGNFFKNRYENVIPYDSTRVILSTKNDFISANHVNIRIGEKSRSYICTQFPLHHTVRDFWQMILDHKVQLVIMIALTDIPGKGHFEYWPSDSEVLQFTDNLKISKEKEQFYEDESGRTMKERIFKISVCQNEEPMVIRHLQFLKWTDHDVPNSKEEFLKFIKTCKSFRDLLSEETPTLVHCSAGIGRTGTTIAAMSALEHIEKSLNPPDPEETLSEMRKQRGGMIQTVEQYIFYCQV